MVARGKTINITLYYVCLLCYCGLTLSLTVHKNILEVLVNSEGSLRTGVLTPVPCHSTSTLSLTGLGAVIVPYYLNEEHGWELQIDELHRALESAKGVCNPVALYVINPGNPSGSKISPEDRLNRLKDVLHAVWSTGHVQSRKSIQDVIRFVSEKKLFLLADEVILWHNDRFLTINNLINTLVLCTRPQVYQDCVYMEDREFVSYKRVLSEMGPPLSDSLELVSFHSASKGFMGE